MFNARASRAKAVAAMTDIANLATCLQMFEVDCGRYPTTAEGLGALLAQPANATGWKGPYLAGSALPKDPWGNPYMYVCPGKHNPDGLDLCSFGPDGKEGGGDDIDNWSEK
jgi:general secretion pathway protein G